jgi:hypothetical protein
MIAMHPFSGQSLFVSTRRVLMLAGMLLLSATSLGCPAAAVIRWAVT